MNALVFVETKQLALGQAAGKGMELPKPFAKDIFLTEFAVAGNILSVPTDAKKLTEGSRLKLFRDTKNKYDKNSIVLKDAAGNRIGFVPMSKNEILARLLEAGKGLYAVVSKDIAEFDDCVEICVKIYLEA